MKIKTVLNYPESLKKTGTLPHFSRFTRCEICMFCVTVRNTSLAWKVLGQSNTTGLPESFALTVRLIQKFKWSSKSLTSARSISQLRAY
jgi:hypothetical protein